MLKRRSHPRAREIDIPNWGTIGLNPATQSRRRENLESHRVGHWCILALALLLVIDGIQQRSTSWYTVPYPRLKSRELVSEFAFRSRFVEGKRLTFRPRSGWFSLVCVVAGWLESILGWWLNVWLGRVGLGYCTRYSVVGFLGLEFGFWVVLGTWDLTTLMVIGACWWAIASCFGRRSAWAEKRFPE